MKRIKQRIEPGWDRIQVDIPVRFNEVDSMKIVWHGHYIAWCECAREMFLRQRGLGYQRMQALALAAPVVRLQIEYLRPAKGGDTVAVTCAHVPDSWPRLEFFYELRSGDGELLAVAESVQVFVRGVGPGEHEICLAPPPEVEALMAEIARRRAEPVGGAGSRLVK